MATTTLTGNSVSAGTITLISTDLNSLASAALVVSTLGTTGVFDGRNSQVQDTTAKTAGWVQGAVTCNLAALAGNPAANSSIDVWFLLSKDGTNTAFEDGSATVTPQRAPDVSFLTDSSRATAESQTKIVDIPVGYYKVLVRNNALGEALAASGNTVTLQPLTYQMA